MLRFFEYDNYVDIIKDVLAENIQTRGYQSQLANAAGCHVSHLSHVLNGRADFSLEQAISFCEFLKFNEIHTDYFIALVNRARAGTGRLRDKFDRDLKKLRSDSLRGNCFKPNNAAVKELEPEDAARYMSAWYYSAIHGALNNPRLRTVKDLANRFKLSEDEVEGVLKDLKRLGLAKFKEGIWKRNSYMALGGDPDPLIRMFHSAVHLKAKEVLAAKTEQNLFMTALFSTSRVKIPETKIRIQSLIRAILQEAEDESEHHVDEELVFLNIDFFIP